MNWIESEKQSHPEREGWYLTLFESMDGGIFPLPLYFQFSWNLPRGLDGTIRYYTEIDNLPVELVSGRVF